MLKYNLYAVVRCKRCGNCEYWGQIHWLNGKDICRDCYSKAVNNISYSYSKDEQIELCR